MAQWMLLQLGHGTLDGTELIDAAALGATHVPHVISNPASPPFDRAPGLDGLGWNVGYDASGTVTLGHSGAFALGASTAVHLRPGDGLGIIVLTNGFPMGVPEAIALTFLNLATIGAPQIDYLDVIGPIIEASVVPPYGDVIQKTPADSAPPLEPDAYLGSYANDVSGPLMVQEEAGSLSMVLGPQGMMFPLTHFNRDVFTYTPPGENGGGISAVTFTIGPDGVSTQVVIENLDLYGAGTFNRT